MIIPVHLDNGVKFDDGILAPVAGALVVEVGFGSVSTEWPVLIPLAGALKVEVGFASVSTEWTVLIPLAGALKVEVGLASVSTEWSLLISLSCKMLVDALLCAEFSNSTNMKTIKHERTHYNPKKPPKTIGYLKPSCEKKNEINLIQSISMYKLV